MSDWEWASIGDLCKQVTSGGTPSRSRPDYYDPGTIPWVKTGDLNDAFIVEYDEYISKAGVSGSAAKLLPANTVLMAMYGATVGKLGMLRESATCNQAACAMITDPDVCEPRWLFYALLNDRDRMVSLANGAAQQNLSGTTIKKFKLLSPSLSEQRAIAEVLGAFDDKIAANTKLADHSVDLATSLFHKSIIAAEFSDQTFADVAKISGGGTPSTKVPEYWDGDINWATPTDVTALRGPYLESTSRPITSEGLAACSSELFQPGTILMTSRATIGAFAIAQAPTAVNQGFIVVEPHDPSTRFWLFHEMQNRVDEFISMANGATFLELSRGNFKKFKVRLADSDTMQAFETKAIPLHAAARNALKENSMLAATRDVLLPQLMSGKLRVKDAESLVAAAV